MPLLCLSNFLDIILKYMQGIGFNFYLPVQGIAINEMKKYIFEQYHLT